MFILWILKLLYELSKKCIIFIVMFFGFCKVRDVEFGFSLLIVYWSSFVSSVI